MFFLFIMSYMMERSASALCHMRDQYLLKLLNFSFLTFPLKRATSAGLSREARFLNTYPNGVSGLRFHL